MMAKFRAPRLRLLATPAGAGIALFLLLLLGGVGCKPTSKSGSGSGGPSDTTVPGASVLDLEVYTAWDTAPEKLILQKTCTVPTGTAIGTDVPCTATIPEGTLHFSTLYIKTKVNESDACSILTFYPYYYRAANTPDFLPEWATAAVDCSGTFATLPADCFSGVGVDMLKDLEFPRYTGIYTTPDAEGKIEQTFSARSANKARRFSGNRWTNNTLSYKGATLNNPPLRDGYVAGSMQDYQLFCEDEYANTNYSISLTVQDVESGSNCDFNQSSCNLYPGWNSSQANDLSPGSASSAPLTGIVSHTVPPLGQTTPELLNETDFFVDIIPDSGTVAYLHVDGDWTAPCRTDVNNTNQDLVCVAEVKEEDLFTRGVVFSYQAPPEQCAYFQRDMYVYYQFQTGKAPTVVNQTITDGTTTNLDTVGSTGETGVYLDQTGGLHCGWDYSTASPVPGPNCCEGIYILNLTEINTTAGTTNTGSSQVFWPGKKSACLNGPAMGSKSTVSGIQHGALAPTAAQPTDPSGYPRPILQALQGESITGVIVGAAPITQAFYSNVYLANFWAGPYAVSQANPIPASVPLAYWPANPAKGGLVTTAPVGQPFYEFDCLDNGGDFVNRLRIMVRSWSTVSEFAVQGNADLNGPQGLPFDDHDLLNFSTWIQVINPAQGFGDSYPGFFN